ncbi:MAG: Type secretion system pilin [Frankiales bacterium]|jgi:hypothetical protein|nr:Type secretion system pilin [Frankiales bacterium]
MVKIQNLKPKTKVKTKNQDHESRPVDNRKATAEQRLVPAKWMRRAWWLGLLVGVLLVVLIEQASVALAASGGDISQVKSFASKLTNYVTAIAASVAVLFIAVNGVRWTLSSGNPARQADAKGGLVAAAAGLAIALSANVIVNLVVAALN